MSARSSSLVAILCCFASLGCGLDGSDRAGATMSGGEPDEQDGGAGGRPRADTAGRGGAGGSALDARLPDAPAAPDAAPLEPDAQVTPDAATEVDAPPPADAASDRTVDATDAGGPSYNPCPPKGTPCVALPLGDSLTQGAGSPAPGGGYRVELFHQTVAHGKAITFVGSGASGPTSLDGVPFPRRHEGHGGFSIGDLATWITDHKTIETYRPDIVMLSIGTNGLKYATDSVPDRLRQLGAMMDQILALDSHLLLVVAQIIPMPTDIGTANVKAYNAGIPALVKARVAAGKHVAIADVYGRFVANPNWKTEYLPNGLHPGAPGYKAMGGAWYDALAPWLR